MHRASARTSAPWRRAVWVRAGLGLLALAAACTSRPSPAPTDTPAPAAATSLPQPAAPASPTPPPVTPTAAAPRVLTVCLAGEPQSLYRYAPAEAGRDHILAALYDGPIDQAAYGHQAVLLEKMPRLGEADARVDMVMAGPGDTVVDALGRVVSLAEGVTLLQPDASLLTYAGGPVSLPQMTVTFRLRDGVLWSDGQPVTAEDSVFSFEVSRSPDSFSPQALAAALTASYRALDAQTVAWTGLPGRLDPQYFTNFWPPLPSHLYRGMSPAEIALSPEANRSPLGWGPFVLREWLPGDRIVFERSPNYFRAREGLPRVDRVVYRFVEDSADLLSQFERGACDIVPHSPELAADSSAWSGRPGVQVTSGTLLEQISFGIAPAGDYSRPAGDDFFVDARARQALAYCLDRAALASAFAGPMAEAPAAYLPAGHPLVARDAVVYPFDPAEGRVRLAELGWTDSDGDGVLDRDGAPLQLSLAAGPAGEPLREQLALAVQQQLRTNCGIEIQVRWLTRGELESDWPDGVVFGRRFDLALFGWRVGSLPPCALWTTDQIPGDLNPGGANAAGYSRPAFDAACRLALIPREPARSAITSAAHAEAQRIFASDLPALPLFFRPRLGAAGPRVAGFELDPASPSELWNIETLLVE